MEAIEPMPEGCELSVDRGGPFYRLRRRFRLEQRDGAPRHNAVAVAIAVSFAWAPLLFFSVVRYLGVGTWDPLVSKTEVHARLLVALPLLLLGFASLERRVASSVHHLVSGGVIPSGRLDGWRRRLERLRLVRDAWWPEAAILGAIYGMTLASYLGLLPQALLRWAMPAIHHAPRGWEGTTAAWWWYVLVAQPLFLFMVARWLARWALWSRVVWSVPEQEPRIQPAHADEAGGIAFIEGPLLSFRIYSLALGLSLMSVWFDEIARGTAVPATFSEDLLTFVGLSLALALLPYLRLTPLLVEAKRQTDHAYSLLVRRYVDAFQARWFGGSVGPAELLGNADFQSLADIGNAFSVVRRMRATVFEPKQVVALLVSMLAPFLVIVLAFVVPATEIVRLLLGRVLG